MINIYSKTNTDFTKNGNATLIPIRADLSITLNGSWALEIEVPYDREGRWELIEEGAVIQVDVNCIRELSNTRQRFRIYDYKKGISSVTAIAFPVAMESTHDAPIDNLVISSKTGVQAMAQIQAKTNKYTLYSDITRTGSTSFANTNVNNAIASGSEGCFVDVWGGEIVYDNLKFSVLNRVGNNEQNKHKIIYGKDITDISYEKDDSGLVTRIYPISLDGIRLNGTGYVDSPRASQYPILHSRFMQAPYKLIEDDISSSTATAQLTNSIRTQITNLASSLSHSVYNTAISQKVEIEYIKKIRTDIITAVQNMATANIYQADANKVMMSAISNGMQWLKDVSKPEWTWHGSDATGWWYGSSTSDRATSEWLYVDRIWRYFGDNSLWQRPRDDDSKKWGWLQESNGKKYGNRDRYYAQKTTVYTTVNGQMKEYYFDDDGIWDESDDTDSDYAWHGSGTSADPYWFGDDSTTGKFLKDGWWFIDGYMYYFDSEGYYDNTTRKPPVSDTEHHFEWDWVETSDGKYWFGNEFSKNYDEIYVTNQWLKADGDWYRFDSNGYAIGDTALENEVVARFTTGMAQLKTLCESLYTQAYNLLYSQMTSYCTKVFNTGVDIPSVKITVNMADLSNTTEYEQYRNLEKVYLGDSVTALDYKHGISAVERIVSIKYDCIRKVNSEVEIGVASSSLSDILKTEAGGSIAGGFDTSVIENTLTSHTNELARLDSAKQNKLTAGTNITIVNDVISATGGTGDCTCYYGVGAPKSSLGNDGDIYADISPDESGCKALTYHRSSNLHDVTANASEGIYDINGSWWTDRYEHTYTLYSISGLTAGEVYTVSFRLKFNRAMTFYDNDEFIGIAVQNSGSCEYRSNPPRNGEFKSYLDTQYKVYIQSVKTTAEWQSYTFEFTAMNANYLGLYFDGIVNGEDFDVDIDNLYISDGTIGDSLTDLYVKVDGEWLVYDNGAHYVAGSNITITKVDGQMVISATDTTYNNFVGATSENNGSAGLVPAPQTSERNKYLKGDGTWAEVQGASAVSDLTDVSLNNLSNNQILKWNSTTQKWENSSGGGGGSDVEANPSDPATDTLNTIGIDGTVYDIAGGGGGSSSGVYVEEELYSATVTSFVDITLSKSLLDYDIVVIYPDWDYTLTYDHIFSGTVFTKEQLEDRAGTTNRIIAIIDNSHLAQYTLSADGKTLTAFSNSGTTNIRRIVGIKTSGDYYSPVIYSTEEREIGVWTDNKPLYQKTFLFNQRVISDNAWTSNILGTVGSGIEIVDYEGMFGLVNMNPHFADFDYYRSSSEYFTAYIVNNNGSNDDIGVRPNMNAGTNVTLDKCTIWYTKDSDVAGSGSYNTLGVPTIHYTTDEQVIGTWIDGKPLYRRTWNFSTGVTVSSNSWQATDIAVADTHINVITDCKALNDDGQMMNYISATTDLATQTYVMLFNSRTNAGMVVKYLTLEYTKTTD